MNKPFATEVHVRWADLDPNFHVLHSKYYDYGATCRMEFLVSHGITPHWMIKENIGPILFREECSFRKEVVFGDRISVTLELVKSTTDFSRWSIRHRILKDGNVLAATIHCDGAWLDTASRKLAVPPKQAPQTFAEMPLATDFSWQ